MRTNVKKELSTMSKEVYKTRSQMIHNKTLNLNELKDAHIIALTISRFPEVDTRDLIQMLWKQGKQVAIPKCEPATHEMTFYIFTSFDELEIVFKDLFEPIIERTTKIAKEDIDLVITPGIAFDRKGYRLGFGGGYYDRFLVDFNKPKISIAFEEQIVEKVPTDAYDLPICKIVTEEQIIKCSKARKEEI